MDKKQYEQIGNVKMNLQFYKGTDEYSDGDIEDDILHMVQQEPDVMKILKQDNRWPVLYHLSPVRQNILEWYPFKEHANALEIGAGCGAVTGALCRHCDRVVSVDLSKRRSTINANRNRDYDNLEIVVGNFNDVVLEEKFDYITLIGVLEYASYYTQAEDPFVAFLEKIRGYLKEDGHLMIAIENKYGLKYWAGAREDHVGTFFEGIEGYVTTESPVRTFGKNRLTQIIQAAGYEKMDYYYPFPDYKFPMQIFSDEHLPSADDLDVNCESYDNSRYHLFNEKAAYVGLLEEGMYDYFANSFFIDVCR